MMSWWTKHPKKDKIGEPRHLVSLLHEVILRRQTRLGNDPLELIEASLLSLGAWIKEILF